MYKTFLSIGCCLLMVTTLQAQQPFFQPPPASPSPANNSSNSLLPTPPLAPTKSASDYADKIAADAAKKDSATQQALDQKLSQIPSNAPPLPAESVAPSNPPPAQNSNLPANAMIPPAATLPGTVPGKSTPPPPPTMTPPAIEQPQDTSSQPAGSADVYTGFGIGPAGPSNSGTNNSNTAPKSPAGSNSGGGWNIQY